MKGQTYVILSILFIIIVSVFAVINVESVEVNYLFWTGQSPLILIILFSVLMGGVITATVGSVKIFHLQREKKMLVKEKQQLENILSEHNLLDEIKEQPIKKNSHHKN